MKNIKEGTRMFMQLVLHGVARIPVGKAQIQAQNRGQTDTHRTRRKMSDVQAAAEIKLVKAQDRAQNERKYRHMYVSVSCFAWDNSNSSGEGSNSGSK